MAKAELRAESAHDNQDTTAIWDELVARHNAIEAIDTCDVPREQQDTIFDEAGDVIGRIMAMPAPHAAAVRWKLDYIVNTPTGSQNYEAAYLAQLVADYHRFLGDSPASHALPTGNLAVIDRLALDAQMLARRIEALARPAREGITEGSPCYGEPFTKEFGEVLSDADIYLALIEEAAATIASHGREIERAGSRLRRTGAQVQA